MEPIESTTHPDPDDALDVITQFSTFMSEGYWRHIQLRDGLELGIGNLRMRDQFQTEFPEGATDGVEFHFHVSGEHHDRNQAIGAGQYGIHGTGSVRKHTTDYLDRHPYLEVTVWMRADVLRSFVGDPDAQVPQALQHLVRPVEQEFYNRVGTATPVMQTLARQILHCPRQGLSKRMFLEGKSLELFGLAMEEEIARHDGKPLHGLKPDTVERIHDAREILLQRLDNPPSLVELARLVGLNECTLKQGFRQIFKTTAFGYLHDYSMEQARQLLETNALKVEEVAQMVGYRNRSAFAVAFRRKFGINPSDYRRMSKADATRML